MKALTGKYRLVILAGAFALIAGACSSKGDDEEARGEEAAGILNGLELPEGMSVAAAGLDEWLPGREPAVTAYFTVWCGWLLALESNTDPAVAPEMIATADAQARKAIHGYAGIDPELEKGLAERWLAGEGNVPFNGWIERNRCRDLFPQPAPT